MKAYWHYMCDENHSWTLFRDQDAVERPSDAVCPHGHEAVTLEKCVAADVVQITIRSATQLRDGVTGELTWKDRYYLVLTDCHSDRERWTSKPYSWHELTGVLNRFRGLPTERAWLLLEEIEATGIVADANRHGRTAIS